MKLNDTLYFPQKITFESHHSDNLCYGSTILVSHSTAADSLYIVTYTTGPSWDASRPPLEQRHFSEHSARLGQLRKEGIIRFGARYSEKGMIIISTSTREAAREIIYVDQAVVNRLFEVDVQKLNIFYDGCLERKKG